MTPCTLDIRLCHGQNIEVFYSRLVAKEIHASPKNWKHANLHYNSAWSELPTRPSIHHHLHQPYGCSGSNAMMRISAFYTHILTALCVLMGLDRVA